MSLNKRSMVTVNKAKFGRGCVRPLYKNYSFSNIPGTILNLFGINKVNALPDDVLGHKKNDKVIFLFIDGFGWEFWEKVCQKYPALERFYKKGVVSQITSQFPSTTAVHLTTIHTGLDVGKSGVYEWYYYEPSIDSMISPLKYSLATDKERETLKNIKGLNDVLPTESIYKTLKDGGVKSYVFHNKDYTPSEYLDVVLDGATQVLLFDSLSNGLKKLSEKVKNTAGPAYFFYYYGGIDKIGHVVGPSTQGYLDEIDNFFVKLENLFFKKIEKQKGLTVLASADHGMVDVDPQRTLYLNKEIPEITNYIKKNKNGNLLVPAGSCRDFFLHIKDANLIKVKNILAKRLKNIAEVRMVNDLLKEGFFNYPTNRLLERIGNLVILPYYNEAVWWYEKGKIEQKSYGHHGGLSIKEMVVPFLSLDY